MNKIAIDLYGFGEQDFGIFNQEEQSTLKMAWLTKCQRNINLFITILSPQQKKILAKWLCDKTSYNTKQIKHALKHFLRLLKKYPHDTYPK